MKAAFSLSVAVLGLLSTATAETASGRYAVKGIGLMSCADFTSEMARQTPKAKEALAWLAGYLTAVNASEDETFDIVSWQSEGMIAQALDARCKAKADEPLAGAIEAMVSTMRPDRVVDEDKLVEIRVGQRQRLLYTSVLRRMQTRLRERGAAVDVTGEYDEPTRQALRVFQRQSKLADSGYPDSITLFRLFNPTTDIR